jgi:hypothetical protein
MSCYPVLRGFQSWTSEQESTAPISEVPRRCELVYPRVFTDPFQICCKNLKQCRHTTLEFRFVAQEYKIQFGEVFWYLGHIDCFDEDRYNHLSGVNGPLYFLRTNLGIQSIRAN